MSGGIANTKQTIFISYARNPDEAFAKQLYQDLKQNGFSVWWDRESMESRGRTFLQELRDAIAECDRLIAVIGPTALKSQYVQSEWDHALLFSKAVVPILRDGDFNQVPSDFSKFHCVDFRIVRNYDDAFAELLRILAEPVASLAPIRTTPSLPPHFMPRRDEIARLRKVVLADIDRPEVITSAKQVTAIIGMGGMGKSVLATALARSADIRRSFVDGIIWLSIGIKPDLVSRLKTIGIAFEDDLKNYVDLETAKMHLPQVLTDKNCLIVLDDVWDVTSVESFMNALGTRCRLLLTTRDGSLATALGTQQHNLGELNDTDALQLLAQWSENEVSLLPNEAVCVARECGNLPFALSLCGAMVHDGIPWSDLLGALQDADLSFIEIKIPNYPYTDFLKSMKVSVDMLNAENTIWVECYYKLVIFPKKAIPESAVSTIWSCTGGLKERDVHKVLSILARKALLKLEGQVPNLQISLHDLQYDYLRAVVSDISNLHYQLLSAYQQKCNGSWPNGPNDGYYFENLAYHLVEAGKKEDLRHLLFDFEWIAAKLNATDVSSLIRDYDYLLKEENNNTLLLLTQSALRLSAHVLNEDKEQVSSQIYGRLLRHKNQYPEIRQLLGRIRELKLSKPWFRLLTPSMSNIPGSPLWRTIKGHEHSITAVAVTPDGSKLVSAAEDDIQHNVATLKIWSRETGKPLANLSNHEGRITSLAISYDSQHIVSASTTGTMILWDISGRAEPVTLQHHTRVVNDVIFTESGLVVSASDDCTLKIWDMISRRQRAPLIGHPGPVKAVVDLHDDRVLSSSLDGTLRVWDLRESRQIRSFLRPGNHIDWSTTASGEWIVGHESAWDIHTLVLHPDRKRVLAGSKRAIYMINIESDLVVREFSGKMDIEDIVLSSDGRWVVALEDKILRVWNVKTGEELFSVSMDHDEPIAVIASFPHDTKIVSGSFDHSIKIWDLALAAEPKGIKNSSDVDLENIMPLEFTPDGLHIICYEDNQNLGIRDLQNLRLERHLHDQEGLTREIKVSSDGKRIASIAKDGTFRVWSVDDGKLQFRSIGLFNEKNYSLEFLSFIQGGYRAIITTHQATKKDKRLFITLPAFATQSVTFKIIDLVSGKELSQLVVTEFGLQRHKYFPVCGTDSVIVVVANSLFIWELDGKQLPPKPRLLYKDLWKGGHGRKIKLLTLTSDYRHAITASYEPVKSGEHEEPDYSKTGYALTVWDINNNGEKPYRLYGHDLVVRCLVAIPNTNCIGSGGQGRIIRIWDIKEGKQLYLLRGHRGSINCIATFPNGLLIASASDDQTLKVWNLETKKEIAAFTADKPLSYCTVAPDGATIIAYQRDGRVLILRLEGINV
jgi:WD40 repeat protein